MTTSVRFSRVAYLLLVALLVAAFAAPAAWAQDEETGGGRGGRGRHGEGRGSRRDEAIGEGKVSLVDAIATAEATVEGGKAVVAEIQAQKEKTYWGITVLSGNDFTTVRIDPVNGKIVSDETKGPKRNRKKYEAAREAFNASTISLTEAIKAATAEHPDAKPYDARFTGRKSGESFFAVRALEGDKLYYATVDPKTGEVLEMRQDKGAKGDIIDTAEVALTEAVEIAKGEVEGADVAQAEIVTQRGDVYWAVVLVSGSDLTEVHVDTLSGSVIETLDQDVRLEGRGGGQVDRASKALANAAVSLEDAVAKAVESVPGSWAYEARIRAEEGKAAYQVEVMDDGKSQRLLVDAQTGEVTQG